MNAVALAGGGARGAFQIGVWKALKELGYEFSIVTGVSVGALNAAIFAVDDFEAGVEAWENITTSKVLDIEEELVTLENPKRVNNLVREVVRKGGISYKGLEELLRKYVDEDKVRASGIDVGILTVKLPGFKPVAVFQDEIEHGKLIDYMLASASLYPVMSTYNIDDEKYIDGGYYNTLPIDIAVERGATTVVAVNLDAPGIYRKIKHQEATIIMIRSHWNLGYTMLFDKTVAKANIQLGYLETMKAFGKLEGFWYTFEKDTFSRYSKEHEDIIAVFGKEMGIIEKNTKSNYYLGKFSAMKTLKKRGMNDETAHELLLAACDITAELLNIDPMEVYSADTMNEKIVSEYKKKLGDEKLDFNAMIKKRDSVKKMVEKTKTLSSLRIIEQCISLIWDYKTRCKKTLTGFWTVASLFPKEAIAALYICFLDENIILLNENIK